MSKKALLLIGFLTVILKNGCLGQGVSDPFAILDNELATTCKPFDRALDVLIILDGSGSVSGNTFDTQLRMVRRLLEVVEIGPDKTKLSVLQYAGYTKVEFFFNQYQSKDEIRTQLDKIRYISGTTRTGRALRKASEAFASDKGARINRPDVAQVVVIVTDGHSQDDPVPAADELRKNGIIVLAVGIGEYVNMDELLEITKDAAKTFQNETLDKFEETFHKIAVGEVCEFAKGPKGAEIICGNETITVNVMTRNPFQGHLYVKGHYKDPFCSVRGGRVVGDPKEISLRIPLNGCGVREQFIFHPRGVLFETAAMLMFHPNYNTALDKAFTIRCFYPDSRFGGPNFTEIVRSDEEATLENDLQSGLIYSVSVPNMRPPCAYTLRKNSVDGCLADAVAVGDVLYHRWECDTVSGEDQSEFGMLVHSCFLTDDEGQKHEVIDSKGCSVDPIVLNTPIYRKWLFASVEAPVVKIADRPILKFKCSLKFCNQAKGQCAGITPPDCLGTNSTSRDRRDVAFRESPRLAHLIQLRRNESLLFSDRLKSNHVNTKNSTKNSTSIIKFDSSITTPIDITSTTVPRSSIRPLSVELQLPPAPPIFVLEANNSTASSHSEKTGNSFAIVREFDPYEIKVTKPTSTEGPTIMVNIGHENYTNGSRPKDDPKDAIQNGNSTQFNLDVGNVGTSVQDLIPQIQLEPTDFALKGLSHRIVALIDFSRVELESQNVMVHDAEDGFEHKSPLNICKG